MSDVHRKINMRSAKAKLEELMAQCELIGYEKAETEIAALRERVEKADKALTAINAIRNSIIGAQRVNWSEHIYPLVAALDAAGYEGEGYELARAKRIAAIDAARRRLE